MGKPGVQKTLLICVMHIIEKQIRSMNCLSYRVGNPILDFGPKNVSSLLPLHINKKNLTSSSNESN